MGLGGKFTEGSNSIINRRHITIVPQRKRNLGHQPASGVQRMIPTRLTSMSMTASLSGMQTQEVCSTRVCPVIDSHYLQILDWRALPQHEDVAPTPGTSAPGRKRALITLEWCNAHECDNFATHPYTVAHRSQRSGLRRLLNQDNPPPRGRWRTPSNLPHPTVHAGVPEVTGKPPALSFHKSVG